MDNQRRATASIGAAIQVAESAARPVRAMAHGDAVRLGRWLQESGLSGSEDGVQRTSGQAPRSAVIWGQNLETAYLAGADLSESHLQGVVLAGANLESANLRACDLRDADLRSAILTRADLTRANLGASDLRGADMRWACLRDAVLQGAIYDEGTRFPVGFEPEAMGMFAVEVVREANQVGQSKG